MRRLETHDTCGTAEYGVDAFARTRVELSDTFATER